MSGLLVQCPLVSCLQMNYFDAYVRIVIVVDGSDRMAAEHALEHTWLKQSQPKANSKPADTQVTTEKSPTIGTVFI